MTAPARTRTVAPAWPLYLAALAVAAVIAGAVGQGFSGGSLAELGIPDPGAATTFGLPALRGVAWLLMALATGSFLLSAFLIPPKQTQEDLNGARLTVDGHLASRTGARIRDAQFRERAARERLPHRAGDNSRDGERGQIQRPSGGDGAGACRCSHAAYPTFACA